MRKQKWNGPKTQKTSVMSRPRENSLAKAVIQVLEKSRTPLKAEEVLQQIAERGLFEVKGKTPLNTFYATITRANKRQGEAPVFVVDRLGRNNVRYSLASKKIKNHA
jgi:HB1, ASXL, restriction endonuclease HTH domain